MTKQGAFSNACCLCQIAGGSAIATLSGKQPLRRFKMRVREESSD